MRIFNILLLTFAISSGISTATTIFTDDLSTGELSDLWTVLEEGDYQVESDTLTIGDGNGENSELNTCIEITDSDDWEPFRLTGQFFMENTNNENPVIFHINREGHSQQFVILAGGKNPKMVEVNSGDFVRPEAEKEGKKTFGLLGAIITAQNKFAYHMNVKSEEGRWILLDEAKETEIEEGTWYDFEIAVKKSKIKFIINGEDVVSSSLLSRTGGGIAFGVAGDAKLKIKGISVDPY